MKWHLIGFTNWKIQIKVEMKFAEISDLELISSMVDELFLSKITDLVSI